jgi:hypothetical protein
VLRFLPALLLVLAAAQAHAGPVLNEILYDPDGPDEGLEFVELWNSDSVSVSLDGVTLESGDGSRPGAWATLWTGGPSDVAPPRGPFLIPAPALHAAIQNGPDAVRLTRGGEVLDLVGYGDLAAPEQFEGLPAGDASSGQSLARVRDGVDTNVNAADWAPEPTPTPGRANHPDVRIVFARGSQRLDPELPWPGETVALSVGVRNRGLRSVAGDRWRLEAGTSSVPGVATVPEDSASVRCSFTAPGEGRFDVALILRDLQGAEIADTLVIASRAGAGPLLIHEIAFHDRGAGEWVELLAREAVSDLGDYALSDRNGHPYRVDRGASPRAASAGEILVIAESPAALRAAYALPESLVLGCAGGWPALNDSDGDDGLADRVRLTDPEGIPSDATSYRAESVERDGSLERLGDALPSSSPASWSESIDPSGGTPGRMNSMRAPETGGTGGLLRSSTPIVRRRPGMPVAPVVLSFGAVARGARVRVLVHDLLGRARRHLVDGQRVLGEAAFVWDGRDDEGAPVPAGAYIARAETVPDHGEPMRSGNLALSVLDR